MKSVLLTFCFVLYLFGSCEELKIENNASNSFVGSKLGFSSMLNTNFKIYDKNTKKEFFSANDDIISVFVGASSVNDKPRTSLNEAYEIKEKFREIASVQADMKLAEPIMLQTYDNFIKHLYKQVEELEIKKEEAIKKLEEEKEKLTECEKNVKVLEKHKEKKKEEYLKEEKERELKQMNETASIKHFRMQREQQEEAEMEEYLLQQQLMQDEYEY